MTAFRSIIVEGVDRVGKDTLIEGLYHRLGYLQELHYQKPKLLDLYVDQARKSYVDDPADDAALKRKALQLYQLASFTQLFHLLSSPGRFLLNRSHLGEVVYAKRYRGYDGSYVFDLERLSQVNGSDFTDTTLLVLLHASDLSFITEDGQSLGGLDKRAAEQVDFTKAVKRSLITRKLVIDVSDGQGRFRPKAAILDEVLEAWNR